MNNKFKIDGIDINPIYLLSEAQRKFLQFTIPFELYHKWNGRENWLTKICKRGSYNENDRTKLTEIRNEYIKRIKEHE